MADNLVEILIKFGLDKSKATEAATQIKDIQKATTEAGAAGVKAEAEVTEATKKTFTSKKDLKEMVKQLGHEFPVLGSIGRLALNPIAAVTASITAAFLIWNKRVNDLTVSLGGIEMPDVSESQIARIDRVADAFGKWAESVAKFKSSSDGIKARLDAALKVAQLDDALNRAMGGEGTDPKAAEARAKNLAAATLEAEGRRLIGASGHPGSSKSESDQALILQKAADKAVEEQKAAQKRLDEINAIRAGEMNPAQQAVFGAKYALRYGPQTTGPEAIAMERANIETQQRIIDQYTNFQGAAARRGGRRTAIATGQAMLDQAAMLRGDATGAAAESAVAQVANLNRRYEAAGAAVDAAEQAGDWSSMNKAAKEMDIIKQQMAFLVGEIQKLSRSIVSEANKLKSESRTP